MLKRVMSVFVMVLLLAYPAMSVHASVPSEPLSGIPIDKAGISPFFVGVTKITASFSISSSGVARGMVNVFPKNSQSLDYILTTASIVNASGSKVKTWTNTKSTINSDQYFIFDQSNTLQNRGQYKFVYTVNCYKNGVVIDTASGETVYRTY